MHIVGPQTQILFFSKAKRFFSKAPLPLPLKQPPLPFFHVLSSLASDGHFFHGNGSKLHKIPKHLDVLLTELLIY